MEILTHLKPYMKWRAHRVGPILNGAGWFPGIPEFDESQLPDDFPNDWIPDDYDTGTYTKLGQVEGASFENRNPVEQTIAEYTGILGEPDFDVDAGEGDRSAQWVKKPWAVGIMGNSGESIVSISRIPE